MTRRRNWMRKPWQKVLIGIAISFPLMAITGFYPWIRLRPWGLYLWVLSVAILMLIVGLRLAARRGKGRSGRIVTFLLWGFVPMSIILIMILVVLVKLLISPLSIERDIDDLTLRTDHHFYYATINVTASDGVFYALYECDRRPLFCKRVLDEMKGYDVSEDDIFDLAADGETIHIMNNEEAIFSYSPADE